MADPPETPVTGESPVASTTTITSSPPTGQVSLPNPTAAPTQTTGTTNMVPTVQTPTPSVGSNTATPASTPTPESTPTTPVANTPTPVQQQQLQHLDQQHIQQQQHMTTVVGQPQLAPQQGQPQMMQQPQQTMVAQHPPQMSQMPMQQQQLQQLQQVQQMSQQQLGQVQQQMGPQQMQMPAQQQLQQPMMSQQQVQMQPQAQQIQPTTALQQQLQQPSLQQLQQQVQVVQQPQAQQNIQQMTQNNQNLSIVQSPTTMTGNIQAGTIRHASLGSFFLPGIQNTILSNMVFQDMLQKQISAGNISQGITVQQNRPQGLTNNQQKNATQSTVSTVQGNNKQLASNKQGTGQQQQQQQQAQQQQQQGPLIGNKPITQSQGTQHLVIGSLGTISNQGNMLGANKTGHVSIAGTSATQVLNPQTQIRLGGPNTLVTSTGQILTSPTLQILNQIQPQIPTFSVGGAQVLMGSQASVQPVVFRTAGPIQGRLGNIQAVTPAQLKRKVEGQNLQLVKLANGKNWKSRTIQPGQPGRPIQPKGGLPDPASKPQTMLVTPKSKKQAATTKIPTSSSTTAVTTTTPSEQNNKNVVVTSSSTTTSKPSTPTEKLETSTPPQEDQTSNPKSAPPQASVQPIVTAQPTVNGSAIVESSGTNGTITEVGVVAKTEPMEVDKGEVDIEEDTTVEMTDQTEESNKGKLKAVIKPHILTHIIDNFVIQEGNEPFPVQKSSLMTDFLPAGMNTSDRSDTESTGADAKERTTLPPDSPKIKCEFCGKVDFAAKFRRSKRFCSISCAKRYNVGCSKRLRLINNQNGIDHPPSGSKYVKKRKTPEMKKKWKRQEGRVTTGPIQRTPSQCSETGAWSSTTSEAASEITTEDEARSTTDDTTTPNDSSPPRSPPVLEREGGFIGNSSQQREAMSSHQRQQYRSQQQGSEVSPGSAGLIVIQPNTGLADSQSSSTSTSSMSAVSPRPASSTSPACHRRHPSTWSVLDVYEFIHLLPGCSPYADEFRSQEIDGQALMLLKEDHLMSAMNMKLGPALKICAKITSLKEEHS